MSFALLPSRHARLAAGGPAARPPAARRWAAALALVALAVAPSLPVAADDLETAKQRREDVRQQRAVLASRLDVLSADKDAVEAALDALEANVGAAEARLATVRAEADHATDRAQRTQAEEVRITAELARLDATVRDLAIGAFIGGGHAGELALILGAEDAGDAARVGFLASLEVERQDAIASRLAEVRTELEVARVAAEDAAREATRVVGEVSTNLEALEEARDLQAGFVLQVEAELERRLAEATALEVIDQQLSEEIRREEAALAARLAAEAEARAAQAAAQRAAGSPGLVWQGSGSLVRVGSFVVDASIGEQLAAMLAHAAADGLVFGGGGYRDAAAQIERRRANCGPTDADIWTKPAVACRPPTARPGHSMHEQGLAIDFTLGGRLITTRADPGFVWLAENAGRYGFRNLPSEPWHWSTTGG